MPSYIFKLHFNPFQSGIKAEHSSEFTLLKVYNDLPVDEAHEFHMFWLYLICHQSSAYWIRHRKCTCPMSRAVHSLSSIAPHLLEQLFQVICSGRRGQLDVTFVVSVLVAVSGLLLFTSLFMHHFIPVAYVITYTQMTCRSIIPVGVLRFCLCISLPASSP